MIEAMLSLLCALFALALLVGGAAAFVHVCILILEIYRALNRNRSDS